MTKLDIFNEKITQFEEYMLKITLNEILNPPNCSPLESCFL